MGMDCPQCGYAMSAFDVECPRCKRIAEKARRPSGPAAPPPHAPPAPPPLPPPLPPSPSVAGQPAVIPYRERTFWMERRCLLVLQGGSVRLLETARRRCRTEWFIFLLLFWIGDQWLPADRWFLVFYSTFVFAVFVGWPYVAERWMNAKARRSEEVLLAAPAAWFTVARLVGEHLLAEVTLLTEFVPLDLRMFAGGWQGVIAKSRLFGHGYWRLAYRRDFQLVGHYGQRVATGWVVFGKDTGLPAWRRANVPPGDWDWWLAIEELRRQFEAQGGAVVGESLDTFAERVERSSRTNGR